MKNNLISVLITNYNKSKFLYKSLSSLYSQNYQNYEIILYDDCSSDNSVQIINSFKKVNLIRNKKRKEYSPALNQINGLKRAYFKSKGNIICLMDSDDYFKREKLKKVNEYFRLHKEKKVLYNLPIVSLKNNFKMIEKKRNPNIWPIIFPTSCISVKRKYFKLFLKNIEINSYKNLEIDARINIFFNFYLNEYNVINKRLTHYNFDDFGITSNIPKYSRKWWFRRSEAFDYLKLVLSKKKKKFKLNFDCIITNFVAKFLNYLL
mgnify:CR=1 FL=1